MRRIKIDNPELDRAEFARTLAYVQAQTIANGGYWVPACGGTETPFKARSGVTLLYCWNPITRAHAYIDTATDMPLSDDEARAHMGTY